jgi:hypothetical protein
MSPVAVEALETRLAQIERERDFANTVAAEAVRMLSDDQLHALRRRLAGCDEPALARTG